MSKAESKNYSRFARTEEAVLKALELAFERSGNSPVSCKDIKEAGETLGFDPGAVKWFPWDFEDRLERWLGRLFFQGLVGEEDTYIFLQVVQYP